MSLAECSAWMITPDDLPAYAVIDYDRRQNWEAQLTVTIDLMYNNPTTDTGHDVNDKPW